MKKSNESYYLVIKKILYIVEIPGELIKFTKYYRDKFSKKYSSEDAFLHWINYFHKLVIMFHKK